MDIEKKAEATNDSRRSETIDMTVVRLSDNRGRGSS